ncbi:hypothetical protein MMPV_007755 [Pyropia vietnamensis]
MAGSPSPDSLSSLRAAAAAAAAAGDGATEQALRNQLGAALSAAGRPAAARMQHTTEVHICRRLLLSAATPAEAARWRAAASAGLLRLGAAAAAAGRTAEAVAAHTACAALAATPRASARAAASLGASLVHRAGTLRVADVNDAAADAVAAAARRQCDRALALADALDDEAMLQAAHITAGVAAVEAGDTPAALAAFAEGLALATSRGDAPGVVLAIENAAVAHAEAGHPAAAAAAYRQMVDAAAAAGLAHEESVGLAGLARAAAARGRHAEAARGWAAAAARAVRPPLRAAYAEEADGARALVRMDAEAAAAEARLAVLLEATSGGEGGGGGAADVPAAATGGGGGDMDDEDTVPALHRRLGTLHSHLNRPAAAVTHFRAYFRSLGGPEDDHWSRLPPGPTLDAAAAAAAALAECLEATGDRAGAARVAAAELRVRQRVAKDTAATAAAWCNLGNYRDDPGVVPVAESLDAYRRAAALAVEAGDAGVRRSALSNFLIVAAAALGRERMAAAATTAVVDTGKGGEGDATPQGPATNGWGGELGPAAAVDLAREVDAVRAELRALNAAEAAAAAAAADDGDAADGAAAPVDAAADAAAARALEALTWDGPGGSKGVGDGGSSAVVDEGWACGAGGSASEEGEAGWDADARCGDSDAGGEWARGGGRPRRLRRGGRGTLPAGPRRGREATFRRRWPRQEESSEGEEEATGGVMGGVAGTGGGGEADDAEEGDGPLYGNVDDEMEDFGGGGDWGGRCSDAGDADGGGGDGGGSGDESSSMDTSAPRERTLGGRRRTAARRPRRASDGGIDGGGWGSSGGGSHPPRAVVVGRSAKRRRRKTDPDPLDDFLVDDGTEWPSTAGGGLGGGGGHPRRRLKSGGGSAGGGGGRPRRRRRSSPGASGGRRGGGEGVRGRHDSDGGSGSGDGDGGDGGGWVPGGSDGDAAVVADGAALFPPSSLALTPLSPLGGGGGTGSAGGCGGSSAVAAATVGGAFHPWPASAAAAAAAAAAATTARVVVRQPGRADEWVVVPIPAGCPPPPGSTDAAIPGTTAWLTARVTTALADTHWAAVAITPPGVVRLGGAPPDGSAGGIYTAEVGGVAPLGLADAYAVACRRGGVAPLAAVTAACMVADAPASAGEGIGGGPVVAEGSQDASQGEPSVRAAATAASGGRCGVVDLTGANVTDGDVSRLLDAAARAATRLRVLRLAANVRLTDATTERIVAAAAASAAAARARRSDGEAGGLDDGGDLSRGGDAADNDSDGGGPFDALAELDLSATGLSAAGFRRLATAVAMVRAGSSPGGVASVLGGLRVLDAAYNGLGGGDDAAVEDLAAGVAALLRGGSVTTLRLDRNLLRPAFLVRLAAYVAGGGDASGSCPPGLPATPLLMSSPAEAAASGPLPSPSSSLQHAGGGGGLITLSLASNADRVPAALLEVPAAVMALRSLAAAFGAGNAGGPGGGRGGGGGGGGGGNAPSSRRGRLATLDVRACGAEAHPGGRAAVVAAVCGGGVGEEPGGLALLL